MTPKAMDNLPRSELFLNDETKNKAVKGNTSTELHLDVIIMHRKLATIVVKQAEEMATRILLDIVEVYSSNISISPVES